MSNNSQPTTGRRVGYIVTILVNAALFFVFNNLHKWPVSFITITEDFSKVLWAINLSLAVAGFVNFIYLFFDPKWFRSLMQAVQNCFSLLSTYTFYKVFPLDLPGSIFEKWAKIGLIVIMGLTCLGIIVEAINFLRWISKPQIN